jgi:hypothetical protein
MEDRTFDTLAKAIAGDASRRRLLRSLMGVLLGMAAGAVRPGRAGAQTCGAVAECPTIELGPCERRTCDNGECGVGPAPAGTVCRAAETACEEPARCTGTSADCPTNPPRPEGSVCRAAAGDCDVAEVCTGTSRQCPGNAFRPATDVCRQANAPCEGPARCSGNDADCPPNPLLPATTLCRTGVGGCDVSEFCTGSSRSCPADVTTPCGGAPNSNTICCKVGRHAGRCVVRQACLTT